MFSLFDILVKIGTAAYHGSFAILANRGYAAVPFFTRRRVSCDRGLAQRGKLGLLSVAQTRRDGCGSEQVEEQNHSMDVILATIVSQRA